MLRRHSLPVALVLVWSISTGVAVAVGRPNEGELFGVKTTNTPQAELALRLWRAPANSRGTLIMCHGFGRSMEDSLWYGWLCDRVGWNVIRFDFRSGFRQMLQEVDVPDALSKRDDLLVWLSATRHDWIR